MKSILEFGEARRQGRPVVMVAAYDALMARLVAASGVDAILVGDSVAMVVYGHPSTIHATTEMICAHVAAVRRAAPELLIVADLPFLSVRCGLLPATEAAGALLRAGATAVKLEGVAGHEEVVAHLVASGIPVMGHLGLTPQAVHQLGGYRLQGTEPATAEKILGEAQTLERLGAFSLVLECVPARLATEITAAVAIPTIGIGAGAGTAGQVLVLSDLLGLDPKFRPRFARRYLEGHQLIGSALGQYVRDVRAEKFPVGTEVLA